MRIRIDKNKPYSIYTISTREEMYNLIHKLNGLIRIKVDSFKKACILYNIEYIEPNYNIRPYDPYFSGLIDTDGSIVFNFNSNRIECNLEFKYNEYSSKLCLDNVIPNYKPYVLCRNKTAISGSYIKFQSIAFKFQTVKGAKWIGTSLKCLQLSNSGYTLKLLVLSDDRKIVYVLTNYLCIVIIQNILEIKMRYCGSKSIIAIENGYKLAVIVKEQRVDGSWQEKTSAPTVWRFSYSTIKTPRIFFLFKVYSNGFWNKLSSQSPKWSFAWLVSLVSLTHLGSQALQGARVLYCKLNFRRSYFNAVHLYQTRFFSTFTTIKLNKSSASVIIKEQNNIKKNENQNTQLDPMWITGFAKVKVPLQLIFLKTPKERQDDWLGRNFRSVSTVQINLF